MSSPAGPVFCLCLPPNPCTHVHAYVHACVLLHWVARRGAKDDECMIEVKCNIILPSSLSISQRALVAAHENIAGFFQGLMQFPLPTLRFVGVSLRL